ncbi:MAG TPA: RNA-binding cell elongation regulator Jag/EloR [Acidimicrobiales bacterium]|nr:RNA-binding cell elongation regulator Jag/EloR [Acidimicrobiales bacterium]
MEWVETTGKSVDEAKEAALDQLGVHESDAEFVVLEEPKTGFLGRVKGEARVRARVRPTAPRPKRGRSRRSDDGARRQGQGQGRGGSRGRGGERSSQKTSAGDGDGLNGSAPEKAAGAVAIAGEAGSGSGSGSGGARKRRRGGRGRGGGGSAVAGGAGAPASGHDVEVEGDAAAAAVRANGNGAGGRGRSSNDKGKEETVEQVLSLEEQGESARRFVEGLVVEMGLDAEVGVRLVDEETAEVTVSGDELGLLIGPGGATLAALQEVTRTVVQRHTSGHSDRIIVDVAGYRAKRAEALARFATKIADEVIESGEERALEPMSPPDRKVVHDTVNGIDGVGTRSEGEEPRRYIVIAPAAAAVPAAAGDEG